MRKHIPLLFGFMAVLTLVSSNAFASAAAILAMKNAQVERDAINEDSHLIQGASVAPDGYLVIGHHHLRRIVDARLELCVDGFMEGKKATCTAWLPMADYVPHKLGRNARYVSMGVKNNRREDQDKLFLFYRVEPQ